MDQPLTDAGNTQLVVAALLGIATVVVLIVWAKVHPFLGLMLGTAVMGGVAAVAPLDIVESFTVGFGDTVGSVGLLIALGAMVGKILADSGGSDTIVCEGTSYGEHRDGPWRADVPEWGAGRWCDVFEIRDFLIQRCFIYLDPDYAGKDQERYPWLADR